MAASSDVRQFSPRETLFGRESELDVLYRLLALDSQGGGVLILRGDPGIGKSALLESARRRGREQGLRVLETGGAETESELPFSGLEQLLHPLMTDVGNLPDRQRLALLSAVGSIDGSSPNVFLIGLGALNLATEAAGHAPLLLVVEDAQWLDRGTAEVLAFLGRRVNDEPITMLIAMRDGYDSPLVDARLDELTVGALADDAAAELLQSRQPRLTVADRQRVLADAGGNPLAVIEFGAAANAPTPDLDGHLPGQLTLSARLERTFASRTDGLPQETRAALLIAATGDDDVLAEVLSATAEFLGATVDEQSLSAAIDAHLIALDGIHVVFRNPLVRSAIYQAASDQQRRQAHAALANTVDDPDRAAWHRAAAALAPDETVASELQRVACRAERRGAIATAVNGLERAAMLSADPERRVERLLRGAELAVELGRTDLVARMVSRVDAEELSPLASAHAAWVRDRFDDRTPGDASRILRLLADARLAASAGDTNLALELLLASAWRTWWALTDNGVRNEVVRAAEELDVSEDDPRLVATLAVASPVRHAATVTARLAGIAPGPDDDPTDACLRGLAAHVIGQSELAAQVLAGAAATMRAQGRLGLLARVLTMHSWSSIQLGNWSNVDTMANEATRLARETGQPLWAAGAQAAEAAAAGLHGNLDLARKLADEVEKDALPARLSNVLCVLQVARGITALGAGRYAHAYDCLIRVFDPSDPAHHFAERHGAIGYLAEAAVHSGHHERARELVAELEPLATQTPATILHLGLLYARPLVAAPDDAEALFDAALEADVARSPFFRARVQLAYGEWLRRQRRVSESRVMLGRARDAFDAIAARPWGDRAREQLRASGESSAIAATFPLEDMTPQQRQIAEMAAQGMTNREIGEQLFLSPRTVASHLYRLFPKLGITSRAELASALRRDGFDHSQNGSESA